MVQGHVDCTAKCIEINDLNGSWEFIFKHHSKEFFLVNKGSVTINGISLTVVWTKDDEFSVNIIPYTYEHTNIYEVKVGDIVNLEFDIFGKYIQEYLKKVP